MAGAERLYTPELLGLAVSLAGEVRPVAHAGLRLREAAKLGFDRAHGPEDIGERPQGLRYDGLDRLPKLVDRVMAGA